MRDIRKMLKTLPNTNLYGAKSTTYVDLNNQARSKYDLDYELTI